MLPADLAAAIEAKSESLGARELARASAELTEWYRAGRPAGFRMTPVHQLAYVVARMPATYSVNVAVLSKLRERLPEVPFESLLDLCAGPGTVLWAAAAVLGELRAATLFEKDLGFLTLGRSLAKEADAPVIREAQWHQSDLSAAPAFAPHPLVTISYGLGELPLSAQECLVRAAWASATQALLMVEPGTPAGYATILNARRLLIEAGAEVLAPCPHKLECPMADQERWCHFSQRLSRTRLHRTIKTAELGYEDEKYSYLIVSRSAAPAARGRIVGTPRESKPAVDLELCTAEGLQRVSIAKRDRTAFRAARRARWGDLWPPLEGTDEDD